jgi:hypothetical protein
MSIEELESTLLELDKEYNYSAEKAAEYTDKTAIIFTKWKVMQEELLELKKIAAKEEAIFTIEQNNQLEKSIYRILRVVFTGLGVDCFSQTRFEEGLKIQYRIEKDYGNDICDTCPKKIHETDCHHPDCGHSNKYKFDISSRFTEGCVEDGCWGLYQGPQIIFTITVWVRDLPIQTKIIKMFEYVKKNLIKEDEDKYERKEKENAEVYAEVHALREKLNLFYPKVEEIIEEYRKKKESLTSDF